MPATPDQIPIAIARSRGTVKTLVMIDSVAGMMSAAPRPITARAPTSWLTPLENAAAVDATPKITRPTVSAPLRPKRSPSAPKVRRSPANTSVYASTTHWRPVMLVPRSRWRVGSATLTIVLSITMTSRLTQSTARVSQRRSCAPSLGSRRGRRTRPPEGAARLARGVISDSMVSPSPPVVPCYYDVMIT